MPSIKTMKYCLAVLTPHEGICSCHHTGGCAQPERPPAFSHLYFSTATPALISEDVALAGGSLLGSRVLV